jgi:hypothetical protein
LLNVTKYILVDDDTLGGTFSFKSNGLNMDPPPRPRAPATQPPRKEKIKIYRRFLP